MSDQLPTEWAPGARSDFDRSPRWLEFLSALPAGRSAAPVPWREPGPLLWSMYTMMKIYAKTACEIVLQVREWERQLVAVRPPGAHGAEIDLLLAPPDLVTTARQYTASLLAQIPAIRLTCRELELDAAVPQLNRIETALGAQRLDLHALEMMVHELLVRVVDQLEHRHFVFVPARKVPLYEDPDLFGPAVSSKFPGAIPDIEHAGRCLALDEATACVFHLMRVLEITVQELGNRLGVQSVRDKTWGALTTEMDAALRVRYGRNPTPPQKAEQEAYAAVLAHLNAVRVAWRNPTMHPKQSYTAEEAEQIFTHVKAFAIDLAQLV